MKLFEDCVLEKRIMYLLVGAVLDPHTMCSCYHDHVMRSP